ncbi:MAG: hypothetical protein H0V35_00600 [Nitrospira sp.]|nr:hypothetical protein [Nitrospira sp.]
MQVKAEGAVLGYVERRSREGKVFRSVDLYVKGRDPGVLRLGIPEEASGRFILGTVKGYNISKSS